MYHMKYTFIYYMNNHYLEDHDIDEVTYMDENQYAKKIKHEQENKISNALMEFEYSDKSDDNKVDMYPSESYYKRLNNQGLQDKDEQFFISKQPAYVFNAYKPIGNTARELGLTRKKSIAHKSRRMYDKITGLNKRGGTKKRKGKSKRHNKRSQHKH